VNVQMMLAQRAKPLLTGDTEVCADVC
jgi:hypothetical protein